jgi:hypothetical protein
MEWQHKMHILKPKIKDELGNLHLYQETIDLMSEALIEMHSSSARAYEESHLSAAMAVHRAVGYIKMAEELEPYNPSVLHQKAWMCDLSLKSSEYMIDVYADTVVKMKTCGDHGYKVKEHLISHLENAMRFELESLVDGNTYYGDRKP